MIYNNITTPIHFLFNGDEVKISDVLPSMTILSWLRANGHIGTKEGCAEGDCGACTVVTASLNQQSKLPSIETKAINACIAFLPTLHGKAIYTVEALHSSSKSSKANEENSELHPVQQAMVDCHSSQCGFCTPGFVMSLWHVYINNTKADENKLTSNLSGNLCRCTGYRPIIEAGKRMFELPRIEFDQNELIKKLLAINSTVQQSFSYEYKEQRFDAPKTIIEFARLRQNYPSAIIIAGGTDVGLWSTKQLRHLPHLIYIGDIAEMKCINQQKNKLIIGASASLNEAYEALCEFYPELSQMWERFASMPIRHAGTLGGNIANGSPIGDSMPALIALAAEVVLCKIKDGKIHKRILPLQDFYVAYQKKAWEADEVLTSVSVPLPQANTIFRTYKVAKRYDSDISAVCGAYWIKLQNQQVLECKIVYGGMAEITKRASETERILIGKIWDESTVKNAMQAIEKDYQPLNDMRSSAQYRLTVAKNLLMRVWLSSSNKTSLPISAIDVFAIETKKEAV